jgi:hypothetical protein
MARANQSSSKPKAKALLAAETLRGQNNEFHNLMNQITKISFFHLSKYLLNTNCNFGILPES